MLKEDRERLRAMHQSQPRFTEGQRRELRAVHPWLCAGRLPAALDLAVSSDTRTPSSLLQRPRQRPSLEDLLNVPSGWRTEI